MGQEQQPPAMQPQTPGGAAGAPMTPQGQPLAEWWKRAVAAIIDSFVVSIPSWILYAIATAVFFSTANQLQVDPVTGQVTGGAGLGFIGIFFLWFVIIGVIGIAYYIYFWGGKRGQTLGKMAMKIRVVDEATGGPIGYGRAAIRWLTILVLGIPCGIGILLDYLWPLWDVKRQALHDKVAKSFVIDVA